MTANVASQLRSFSSFDVWAYGPRVNGPIEHSLMIAGRLNLLRIAGRLGSIGTALSPGAADDLPCLARVNALGDACSAAVTGLCAHTFRNYSMLAIPAAHRVLCYMVNRDVGLWVSELMRAVQQSSSAVVPSRAGTGFDPPPLPKFVRALCRGGAEVLRLVLSCIGAGGDRPPSGRPSLPSLDHSRPREKPVRASLRSARCLRAPANARGLLETFCMSPPRPRQPRHLYPPAVTVAVEARRRWAEGRGRCR